MTHGPSSGRRHLGYTVFVIAILFGSAWPWAEYHAALHNTLHETKRWRSSKTDLRKGVIGGATARLTRVMLHRDRLDLSAWFGFQEVCLGEPLAVESLCFAFEVADDAYLSVLCDRGGTWFDHLSGFRLSRRADTPSIFLTTGNKRLFERTEPVDVEIGDGWHTAELEFRGAVCRLRIDGSVIAEKSIEPARRRRIGFRGGSNRCLVDDVEVRHRQDDGRETAFCEGFDRTDLRFVSLGAMLGIGLALFLGLGGALRVAGRRGRRVLVLASAVIAPIGLLGWLLFTLDHFWLSARYPADPLVVPEYPNTMFRPEEPELAWENRFPAKADRERLRILLLGGSQTWGAGATTDADVWSRLLEQRLNDADGERAFECINRARSGANTADLLAGYRESWRSQFEPHLTVLNVGHNDFDGVAFVKNLAAFAEIAQQNGSPLVFVLEANAVENRTEVLAGNHAAMRIVAAKFGVPLIDLDARLAESNDRGFLWWDRVHLTSAGQELMAEEMTRPLLELLR